MNYSTLSESLARVLGELPPEQREKLLAEFMRDVRVQNGAYKKQPVLERKQQVLELSKQRVPRREIAKQVKMSLRDVIKIVTIFG